jgi:hypothetical protein
MLKLGRRMHEQAFVAVRSPVSGPPKQRLAVLIEGDRSNAAMTSGGLRDPRIAQRGCGRAHRCASGHQPPRTGPCREEMRQSEGKRSQNERRKRETEEKKADEVARRRTPFPGEGIHRSPTDGDMVSRPSEVVKASGTPTSVILTREAPGARAFRVSRSCHERRACARCARERTTACFSGAGDRLWSTWISTCWGDRRCMHARRCCLRLQSRQNKGGEPTGRGWSSTRTWRGLAVGLPFH